MKAKLLRPVAISGTGKYLPEKVLTNADLQRIVDTSDEWITERTGIKERRIAAEDEATSDLAIKAGRDALENAGVEAADLDLIIVATFTPDMFFPSTACFVQKALGAAKATCFDVSAACSGFLYCLDIGRNFIATGAAEKVLVIGADKVSGVIDWADRNTCVLFGDGAGAAVLQPAGQGTGEILSAYSGSNGALDEILNVPGGGSRQPLTAENIGGKSNTMKMSGREVYRHAVTTMIAASKEAIARAGLTTDDITCFIPHQANLRIIETIAGKLHVPMERFFVNLESYGNTSAAAVAIALDEAQRSGRIKRGDHILMVVFGGGLTWASSVVRW
ncbi:MAG: ketoacyl-ACP synthase III [Chthoniobacterales bacterium]|nr:ketoacyl-ACP synthase III [Chthoniobacterales bacterium]